jgi:hypothetical protein
MRVGSFFGGVFPSEWEATREDAMEERKVLRFMVWMVGVEGEIGKLGD